MALAALAACAGRPAPRPAPSPDAGAAETAPTLSECDGYRLAVAGPLSRIARASEGLIQALQDGAAGPAARAVAQQIEAERAALAVVAPQDQGLLRAHGELLAALGDLAAAFGELGDALDGTSAESRQRALLRLRDAVATWDHAVAAVEHECPQNAE